MPKKVAIFGGGIAGLTVAQELAERKDFEITIYEKTSACGGKAKSVMTKEGCPGEHSVRTISRTYYHFRDTLKRIPSNDGTISDHVVAPPSGSRKYLLFKQHQPCVLPTYFPLKPSEFAELLKFMRDMEAIIPKKEMSDFIFKLIKSASMSSERRLQTLGKMTWDEYMDIEHKSKNFQNYLHRLPEFYVAAKGNANAKSMSMLVEKSMFIPIMHPIASRSSSHDVFDGPTSDVLITPWVKYLESLNVKIRTHAAAQKITLEDHLIKNVLIETGAETEVITADIFVFAVPVEVMTQLVEVHPEIKISAPSLSQLNKLNTEESSGMQFFLKNSIREKFPKGFTAFCDSPWSIVAIYQDHPNFNLKSPVVGYLSIAWSNFDELGILYNKPARECTAVEMKNEILAQMAAHIGAECINEFDLYCWNIDPEIAFSKETGVMLKHQAPLFVQLPNSYEYQPESYTEIKNLFLAADYVRTTFDLATMESANEAGRRCANSILKYVKHPAKSCFVKNDVTTGFGLFQIIDQLIFRVQQFFKTG